MGEGGYSGEGLVRGGAGQGMVDEGLVKGGGQEGGRRPKRTDLLHGLCDKVSDLLLTVGADGPNLVGCKRVSGCR